MRILITGGAGFIGSNLSNRVVSMGHQVTVLDSLSPQIHGAQPIKTSPLYRSICDKVNFIHGSVCDQSAWQAALADQDSIVHLAAETGTGQSMYEIKRYVDVNVSGTALMLDCLANSKLYNIKKVIVASSRSIYGEGKYFSKEVGVCYPKTRADIDMKAGRFDPVCPVSGELLELLPTDEDSKIHPSSIYGITKQTQEQMIMTVCPSINIAATALRLQNVYGPGQSLSNPYTGILSIFSTRIKNKNPIQIFEDGKESRDFVFIDDVVDAFVLSLFNDFANNQIFGIGSGVSTDVLSVANALIDGYGVDVPINITGAYRLGDIRHNYADISKAFTLLGYSPSVTFREGINRFISWVDTQEIQQDKFDTSISEMKERGLFK